MIQVYKFGGASVKDASGIKNVCRIIKNTNSSLLVVVSAMGKTTNAMEKLVDAFVQQKPALIKTSFKAIFDYHNQIVRELFDEKHPFILKFDQLLKSLWERVQLNPGLNDDFEYDQIVSMGEMISTQIVSAYANTIGITNQWLDVRRLIKTDENYRDAKVDWEMTKQFVQENIDFEKQDIYLTQGFIGSSVNHITTTLGREGSDYSGAVLAHVLNADSLSIWKDVPGVLNADPRWYPSAQKLSEVSYSEAVELAYYGAQVIHPKTLKPLQNKNIPLFVKSFVDEKLEGTVIRAEETTALHVPVYILKPHQLFITISPKDFSFIVEDNLSDIFAIFSKNKVTINLMQNSALNFTVCVNNVRNMRQLIEELQKDFVVKYNENVELLTIRNYTETAIQEMLQGKEVVDSQLSRKTARYVLKVSEWAF